MSWGETLMRVGLALALVFPIGWEREVGHKPAGLRTHLLVGLGCCLFMLVSLGLSATTEGQRSDPARIAAQIVTGIGFLGGGAILRGGGVVRGMTTAASIWSVAAIGMACGAGLIPIAIVGALATYIVLSTLERWEQWVMRNKRRMSLRIRVRGDEALARVRETLEGLGIRSDRLSVEASGPDRTLMISGSFSGHAITEAFQDLSRDPEVISIERHQE
jgi:putative Mg2+ transporter-C (MgtC) family protein